MVWLPPSRISSLSGPNRTMRYADYAQLLKTLCLEKDPAWRKVKGGENPDPLFIEREMILRFFAFTNRQPFYAGNLKRFLNEYMESWAPSAPDQLKQQAAMFRDAMRNVY